MYCMYTWHLVNCNIPHKSQARKRNSCKDSFRYSKLVFDSVEAIVCLWGWVVNGKLYCEKVERLVFRVHSFARCFMKGNYCFAVLRRIQPSEPTHLVWQNSETSLTSVSRTTFLGAGGGDKVWTVDPGPLTLCLRSCRTEYEISTTPPI
jgi:hypothetical protein